jgi:hypothetical protein
MALGLEKSTLRSPVLTKTYTKFIKESLEALKSNYKTWMSERPGTMGDKLKFKVAKLAAPFTKMSSLQSFARTVYKKSDDARQAFHLSIIEYCIRDGGLIMFKAYYGSHSCLIGEVLGQGSFGKTNICVNEKNPSIKSVVKMALKTVDEQQKFRSQWPADQHTDY